MTRRLAVTGASGFVGRDLCRLAAAQGWDVIGLARSAESGRRVAAADARPQVISSFDAASLAPAFDGAAAVVHLAQIGSERSGQTYEGVNLGGTRAVIEAAGRAGVPRIVFLSGLGVAHYGVARHCTNAYFRSKLGCEAELFRSGLDVVVFRPSYVVGAGSSWIRALLDQLAGGEVECAGDGGYRLQPIAVRDAAAAIVAAAARAPGRLPFVFDLVGPEPVPFLGYVERLARAASRSDAYRVRHTPLDEALAAARGAGWRGLPADELDCLLSDEVSDPRPLEGLLGRFLTPLDDALAAAARAPRA